MLIPSHFQATYVSIQGGSYGYAVVSERCWKKEKKLHAKQSADCLQLQGASCYSNRWRTRGGKNVRQTDTPERSAEYSLHFRTTSKLTNLACRNFLIRLLLAHWLLTPVTHPVTAKVPNHLPYALVQTLLDALHFLTGKLQLDLIYSNSTSTWKPPESAWP